MVKQLRLCDVLPGNHHEHHGNTNRQPQLEEKIEKNNLTLHSSTNTNQPFLLPVSSYFALSQLQQTRCHNI